MELKSRSSTRMVYTTFTNRSSRFVDLFWVDFKGSLVRYFTRIAPRQEKRITTFVTHPWVARDSDTGLKLYLSGKRVFVTELPQQVREREEEDPLAAEENVQLQVLIHIPVYTLEEVCTDFLRRFLSREDLSNLEINQHVQERLLAAVSPPSREYIPVQRAVH